MRLAGLACLLVVGSQVALFEPDGPPAAEQLWQQGQAALKAGEPDRAIAKYQESLANDAQLAQNHLSLAAPYVEKGDDAKACDHLGKFLKVRPEHKTARSYYAEGLLKLRRFPEARDQFERVLAQGQEGPAIDYAHLVHCHGRLLEIAEGLEDDYLQHLHRGIGMYRLAQQYGRLNDPDETLSTEALLCKAAAELYRARTLRPGEARPVWYLHAVWHDLAQHQLARRWLHEAERLARFTYLTPAEQTQLQLATRAATGR